MFAKVHPAEDVKSGNTGSCHDLVRYLEKETGEGQRFFSHTEQDISPERVIMDIDGNKKALGANDAKFFMLSLNPSQSEQMHLIGRKVDDLKELTPQEKKEVFQKLEAFTRSAMDEYALNFGRDNIRGGQDLMYYARVETELSPLDVLQKTQSIERELGRTKKSVNGAYSDRLIDIDLLLYEDLILSAVTPSGAELNLPHPLMAERDFVMKPLAEIAPELVHPVLGKTMRELISSFSPQ